jgi:hypothetical protein
VKKKTNVEFNSISVGKINIFQTTDPPPFKPKKLCILFDLKKVEKKIIRGKMKDLTFVRI